MTPALPFTNQKMRERQQERIRTLERAGMTRKVIAAHFDVDVSNFHAVMSGASTYVLPARLSEGLIMLCNRIHLFRHIEELLPPGFCITRIPEGKANGDFRDELMEGQETLGDTSRSVKAMSFEETRAYGRKLVDVGTRIQQEAALKLRKANGNGLFDTTAGA